MIVVDASVIIPIVSGHAEGRMLSARILEPGQPICAPYLLDVEVVHALRRIERLGNLDRADAFTAVEVLLKLPIDRYPHDILIPRMWQLRGHVSAYDATYIALAEGVRGTLLTRDARLKHAVAGLGVAVEVV
jgi:predicted nucleic acid-binding protein